MTELALKGWNDLRSNVSRISNVWLMIIAIPLLLLAFDPAQTVPVVTKAAASLLHTAPYILVAVLLVAYLKATGAETLIARAFEGRETRMIFFAALFGGLAPFCSCEVIPFIAGLLALGAPLSAIMAFWLASPLVDPATTIITAKALGWDFAMYKAVFAVGIGLYGGFAVMALSRTGLFADPLKPQEIKGCCGCGPSPMEGKPAWKFWTEPARIDTFKKQAIENGIFLFKWLAFAYLLEGLMITYIPAEMVGKWVGGDGLGSIVLGGLIGAPAYLNGYVAPPLVAGLIEQGMSQGAAMAFIMSGAVSCIPAMAGVWSIVRLPVFTAYVVLGLVGAILSGMIFHAVI